MSSVLDVLLEERVMTTACGRCGCESQLYKVYHGIPVVRDVIEWGYRTDVIPCEENCNCDHSM